MNDKYVHGYSDKESVRLKDQSVTLGDLLHHDTIYPAGSTVLEAGCGIGAQTCILAGNNPDVHITSVDISPESLKAAKKAVSSAGITNVTFSHEDIFDLPFDKDSFDHIFICFVLEHLSEPEKALLKLKDLLKPDGTITVIEGDHGSAYYHPASEHAQRNIQCLIDIQAHMGGDSLIGRRLYPLLVDVGLRDVSVSPRFVYADASRPGMVEGFTRNTFNA
ncbi:MAG: methyltransferase domain-containing protein, partial [Chloroflexi bacterium]|nr:methyltransferase domain-containing protein [Chloroflexota bacterium]